MSICCACEKKLLEIYAIRKMKYALYKLKLFIVIVDQAGWVGSGPILCEARGGPDL